MKLEVYASRLFEEFCKKQHIEGRWEYLNSKRKLVWIEEAYFLLENTLLEVKNQFKPLKVGLAQASFEIGYNQGMVVERNSTIARFESMLEDLEYQYDELQQKYNN